MNTNHLFEQLAQDQHLSSVQMQELMQACMTGKLTDCQITAFLALMRMKGETVEELTVAARIMLDYAHSLDLGDEELIDIVGTGGDGKSTFNISTLSSFVTAAAGASVAKHGGSLVSSRSGSADLLLAAGFNLQLSDEQLKACMDKLHLCFLFAPNFHPAMKQVRTARQQLGIRSFFNLLGPLINPAGVKRQVVGVCAHHLLMPIAQVLANLGSKRVLVVHARDGMDEISISAVSDIVEFHQGQFKKWAINPDDYDLFHADLDSIVVNSPEESLAMIEAILNGQPGPGRDIVLLNSAAALYCADKARDIKQGIQMAAKAIDQGEAKSLFYQLRDLTCMAGI